jgi:hypothetical protein
VTGGDARAIEAAREALGRKDAALKSRREASERLRRAVEGMEAIAARGRGEIAALEAEIEEIEETEYGRACGSLAQAVADWAGAQAPRDRLQRLLSRRLLDWGGRNGLRRRRQREPDR